MADSDAIRKISTIALTGGRAFFVPAGFAEDRSLNRLEK